MTQKLKTLTKIFLSCLVFILSSCEKENIDVNNQDASVTNAKNWFEKSNPELSILKYTKQIDWNHAIVTDGVKGKVVEVPIVLKDNLVVKGDDKTLTTYNRLMFIVDEKGICKLSHVLITTKENTFTTSDKTFNFYKIKDNFEGYITVLNAKNKVSYINAITKKASSITGKIKIEDQVCLAMCKMYDDGSYDVLYLISCGGGASDGGSGGDGGYGGDGTAPTETTTQTIEKNINDSQLTPCLKGILEQLKNASNHDISSILEKFGASSTYNINMLMGSAGTGPDYAQTKKITSGYYEITVDTDKYSGATKLYRAQALLHEIIHAYFRSVVDDYNMYPTNAPYVGFPVLYQKYFEKNYPKGLDQDHEEMANKYVDAIALTLQEYDANYTVPYQVYQDLVWGGLRDTPIYDKKGSAEKQRIEDRFRAEQNGAYSNTQSAIGKPCN